MGFLGIDWGNLFQNYNWSHIFAVWAMFLGTWAMVKYTENFRGVFPDWKNSDRIARTEHIMALFALFANLGKIHLDWFYRPVHDKGKCSRFFQALFFLSGGRILSFLGKQELFWFLTENPTK